MSARLLELARPEIRELVAYASARSLHSGAGVAAHLDANELAAEEGTVWHRYPDPQPPELLRRVAQLYGTAEHGVLLARGADEGIDLLLRVFCRAGTDRVVTTPPTYGMYAVAARIQGAEVLELPQRRSTAGFAPDPARIVEACERGEGRVKLVFLCSPNNPTGETVPPELVEGLCEQLAGRAIVVLDEAYVEFSERASLVQRTASLENLVVLRTLSKAWGAAGLRLGLVFADPGVVGLLQKVRAPYPLSQPAVEAAAAILTPAGLERMRGAVRAVHQRREVLARELEALPWVVRVFPSEANFLLVETHDARASVERAAAHGVLVRDLSALPGLAGCVRVSVGAPAELDVLRAAWRELEVAG